MGPVVVSVVLVGACIAIGVWYAVGGGRTQAATTRAGTGRGPVAGGPRLQGPAMRLWVRVRSAAALVCLSTLLGLALAAAVCVVIVLLFLLLQASVG